MVKLANTPDLGSGVERLAGSSPVTRTIKQQAEKLAVLFIVILFFRIKILNLVFTLRQNSAYVL